MNVLTTLGALADGKILEIGDGYRTNRAEYGEPGLRIIRVADVADGEVSFDGPDSVSMRHVASVASKAGQVGDILLTTKGTVGRVAIVRQADTPFVYSPQLCYFRITDPQRINRRYLGYWFKSEEFWNQAQQCMNNTDMAAYINLRDIRSLQIQLPSIRTQRSVAEVLGALDDKIVVNLRVGKLAIALADFKFAVAARSAAMSCDSFADLASIGGGGTPSTKVAEFWGGRVPWATPTDVTGLPGPYLQDTTRHLTAEGLESCASPLYPEGSILMTSRATIGAFAVLARPCAVNQGFIVVRPRNERLRWWLFHELRRRVPEFISHANGATFLELSRGEFKKFRVHLATEAVMKKFCVDAAAIHGTAQAAHQENVKLADLRDALLPGLMSGRIKVKDAEDRVGEVL
jgi:type I restriction enzyme, S subunit